MKFMDLLEQYKFSLKTIRVSMPISAVILFIFGIVMSIVYSPVYWVGIIVSSIGIVVLVMFFIIKNYLVKQINYMEKEKNDNNHSESE